MQLSWQRVCEVTVLPTQWSHFLAPVTTESDLLTDNIHQYCPLEGGGRGEGREGGERRGEIGKERRERDGEGKEVGEREREGEERGRERRGRDGEYSYNLML